MIALIEANLIHNPRLPAICVEALLKSFVVLASAGVLCLTWRRAASATRHLIWFIALAGLLLLPLLPLLLPAAHRPLWSVSSGLGSGNEISLTLQLTPHQPIAAANQPTPVLASPSTELAVKENGKILFATRMNHHGTAIAFTVWACGAVLTLLYPVLGRFQLRRICRKAGSLENPSWTSLLNETSAKLGLHRRVRLLQTTDRVMPLTWGWLWPKVLLPAEADQWPLDRQRIVLLHELAHVKRGDCLTQTIARFVCALYWFNPHAWLAARLMCVERERACDDLVLNGGCRASDYANQLVEIAKSFRHAPQMGAIAMARPSGLEKRIVAIVDATRVRRCRPLTVAAVLVLLCPMIYCIGASSAETAPEDAKSSAVNEQTLAQIEKFSAEKEAQSKMLAAAAGEKILPQFQKYFDAAKNGDYRTVTNMYADFKKYHPQYSHGKEDFRPAYRTSYWQPMLEISLIYDQFAMSDSKYTRMAVDDIIKSIPAGSIYFGGTDPGRGLPTAFSKSHVDADPFYTISQNPLSDPTYDEYIRETYGEKRRTLAQLAAARQADPELSELDKQYQEAKQKALTLEMSKPDNDPERQAAEKALEDLNPKERDLALARVEKSVKADDYSAATNSWAEDKVIYIPTMDDLDKSFVDYMADAQRRVQEKKLKPGEDVRTDTNGHVQVSGQVAVQAINARISKIIFDKNPNREFYVEESFPHDWMYPYLEPNGLIMKINRQPLAELPDDVLQKDHDYWQSRVNAWLGSWLTEETPVQTVADFAEKTYGRKDLGGFTGDPGFVRDNYAPKMFSKWRSSIAGVYAWRLGFGVAELPPEYAPKSDAEKQKLMQAADFAFKQAFAMCPFSPEAVFSYVNFLTVEGRKSDALLVVQAAASIDPTNEIFPYLEKNLTAQLKSSSMDSQTVKLAKSADRLRELSSLRVQKEAEYDRQKTVFEKLKSMNHDDLRRALPIAARGLFIAATDTNLNELMSELGLAEQHLISLKINYKPEHPAYKSAEAAVNDLQHKIDDRMEGIMLGLESQVASKGAYLKAITVDLEEVRRKGQSGQ